MDGSVGRSSESKVGLDDEIIIYFGVGEKRKKGIGCWNLKRIRWVRWRLRKRASLKYTVLKREQPRYLTVGERGIKNVWGILEISRSNWGSCFIGTHENTPRQWIHSLVQWESNTTMIMIKQNKSFVWSYVCQADFKHRHCSIQNIFYIVVLKHLQRT